MECIHLLPQPDVCSGKLGFFSCPQPVVNQGYTLELVLLLFQNLSPLVKRRKQAPKFGTLHCKKKIPENRRPPYKARRTGKIYFYKDVLPQYQKELTE